jgi:hypothetical protein
VRWEGRIECTHNFLVCGSAIHNQQLVFILSGNLPLVPNQQIYGICSGHLPAHLFGLEAMRTLVTMLLLQAWLRDGLFQPPHVQWWN